MSKKRISDRAFVELHVDVPDSELVETLRVMEKIGYDIIAVVNRTVSQVAEIQEHLSRALILSKLYVHSRELGKIPRLIAKFDLIAVQPENRFVLNKIVRLPEVDIVTVDLTNIGALPSKDQLKVMAEEGKALEVLIDQVLAGGYRALKIFDMLIQQALRIDNLVLFFSQNVKNLYSIKNPRDILALVQVVADLSSSYLKTLREDWLRYIVDIFYKRGVRATTYYLTG